MRFVYLRMCVRVSLCLCVSKHILEPQVFRHLAKTLKDAQLELVSRTQTAKCVTFQSKTLTDRPSTEDHPPHRFTHSSNECCANKKIANMLSTPITTAPGPVACPRALQMPVHGQRFLVTHETLVRHSRAAHKNSHSSDNWREHFAQTLIALSP